MFCKVNSGQIAGIEGRLVQVEADISDGLPSFEMVGYLASDVREAQERIQTAFRNSNFLLPPKKIMVNLSPASERKGGTFFDMAIAVAVLSAYGVIPRIDEEKYKYAFFGEIGLDGSIRGVRGMLSLVLSAKAYGLELCFVPRQNHVEASIVEGIEIVAISTLRELTDILCGKKPYQNNENIQKKLKFPKLTYHSNQVDFSDVRGRAVMRRASEIAAAGHHNILFIGPPGTGKTMIARRIATILPTLSIEEQIEISKVYSVCGLLNEQIPLVTERPFRSPHHTVTPQALVGGGSVPRPGEVSLAGKGVLFLDELAEVKRSTLDLLREPLEERKITITRVQGAYEFPADMILVAATNPCPCGYYPDRSQCICSERQVRRYLGKISKPLLERIDIAVEARPIHYEEIFGEEKAESSEVIRTRVERARQRQRERFYGTSIVCNGEMRTKELKEFCSLGAREQGVLENVFQKQAFHVRNYEKIVKLARTIADLEGEEHILEAHIKEAIFYRTAANYYWEGTRV